MSSTKGGSAIERFRQKVQQQPTATTQRPNSSDKIKQQPVSYVHFIYKLDRTK